MKPILKSKGMLKYYHHEPQKLNAFCCVTKLKQFLLVLLPFCVDHDWLIWLSSRKLANESVSAFLNLKT